jgi:signal transduction histidine kinase
VVLNLVLNALDAVEERTGEISVTTRYDVQNNSAILTVSDNGPGIANSEAIFKPFHTSKKKAGIGLGLPITKKIVELHSGQIIVQSEPPKGADFIVTLPIKKAAEDD